MAEQNNQNNIDPTKNVLELVNTSIRRLDDLHGAETKRIDDKFKDLDVKYQIQFTGAEKAVAIASTAQEKLVAQALDGTKEAISKNDTNTDKRFQLLSEKIDAVMEATNKNAGERGVYVTHTDLNIAFDKFRVDIETILRPLSSEVKSLRDSQNTNTGKSTGLNASWGYLIQAVGFVAVIISIFFALNN